MVSVQRVDRTVLESFGGNSRPTDLEKFVKSRAGSSFAGSNFECSTRQPKLGRERDFIEELLRRHYGNVTRAVARSQKDRRAFGRLVKKYGLCRRAS